MALNLFKLQLSSVQDLAPGVKHFAFEKAEGDVLAYTPGQFINLYFVDENEKRHQRSYSIATISNATTLIEIAVSYIKDGIASEKLWQLKVGDTIEAAGPVGRLVLKSDEHPKRFIFVGTGTGISPYRAMLPELRERLLNNPELHIEILFGVRSHNDLFYAEDFLDLTKEFSRARFYVCYSRQWPENLADWERPYRVTKQLQELNLNASNDIVYLCGNPSMIDEAFTLLQEKSFEHKHVKREKYVHSHR